MKLILEHHEADERMTDAIPVILLTADQTYFVDGITDQVRGKLAGFGAVQVIARASSEQYRETTRTPQEIGKELGVAYLLDATVAWDKSGGRIYLLGGEQQDLALDHLEKLLKVPNAVTPQWTRIDPAFKSFHGNARYEELVAGG